jgi:hypothetical protein
VRATRARTAGRVRSAGRVATASLGGAVAVVSLTGCSQFAAQGLQLRTDESITIELPADRADVSAPIEVRWVDDAPRVGGSYLVLIDRAPMPPGEDVAWFARDDDTCIESQGCPDELWLARRGITVTAEPSATIEIVPARSESRDGAPYDLTVVRLDADGRRDGEGAFSVQFRLVEDEAAP